MVAGHAGAPRPIDGEQELDGRSAKDRFAPLDKEHPLVNTRCALCGRLFQPGQRPTLVSCVPASWDDELKLRAGQAYTAAAIPVHQFCAYPEAHTEVLAADGDPATVVVGQVPPPPTRDPLARCPERRGSVSNRCLRDEFHTGAHHYEDGQE